MTAIEFLKKLDLDKFDLISEGLVELNWGMVWIPSSTTMPIVANDPSKVIYPKNGFALKFKDKTLEHNNIKICYTESYTNLSVSGFGITYTSNDLDPEERLWLEIWVRNLAKESYRLREEKLNSFLVKSE